MKLLKMFSLLRLLLIIAALALAGLTPSTFAQPAKAGVVLRDEEKDEDEDADEDEEDEDEDEEEDDDDDRN